MRNPSCHAIVLTAMISLSGCDYFSTTTVPATDTFAPVPAVTLWFDGYHQELAYGQQNETQAYNNTAFSQGTTDPRKTFLAVATAWDEFGVQEVRLSYRLRWRCMYGPSNNRVIIPWTDQVATQQGGVGDVVQDGLWTAFPIRFIDYHQYLDPSDCSGAYRMTLRWYARGRDFHGNISHYGSGELIYMLFE